MPDSSDRYVGLVTDDAQEAFIRHFEDDESGWAAGIAAALRSLHEAGRIVLPQDLEQIALFDGGRFRIHQSDEPDCEWMDPVFRMKEVVKQAWRDARKFGMKDDG